MKKLIPYVLSVALIASVALNVRLMFMFDKSLEDHWVEYFKTFQKDDETLYYLEAGDIGKAKELLTDSIKTKGMLFFIFTEENTLSEEALEEIKDNIFRPDEIKGVKSTEK
ncbi:hypothetical protein KO507_02500 [Gilvimarinus agarilyticus]|uniref:hypothetical protein n=1 Tax=Gilvimarinus sp. 2_MG-2023 TaxID=3062666 RepID=UPI001C08BEF0|nr:hypothetical protein [Gilvimarinus sp. 2_MG-2023]MBU2884630.1 hypothetical protein [Gilvimarinus agarilyticus]MDO6569737.1 hypothetical protein [Gilvimarinus sp. 2_MG-2023]